MIPIFQLFQSKSIKSTINSNNNNNNNNKKTTLEKFQTNQLGIET